MWLPDSLSFADYESKRRQQRAAGVKSSAARMSISSHQELICAPVSEFQNATYII